MKRILLAMLVIQNLVFTVSAQDKTTPESNTMKPVLDVYINCISCDFQYLKENQKFLNFSRDPKTADVHIIVTSQVTGSGGEEFMMEFAGRQRFVTIHDTLKFTTDPDLMQYELREMILEKLNIGLIPFLLKTSFAKNITVFFDDFEDNYQNEGTDKWRNWVFSINLSGSANLERSFSNYTLASGLYASKITPDIKLELSSDYNFSETTCRFWDNDSLIASYVSTFKEYAMNGLFVKSAGDHFGFGCIGAFRSSLFSNLDKQIIITPTIECNLFKYSDASRRQLIIRYSIGYEHADYCEPTIYNKTNDRLFVHYLNIGFSVLEKFGSIDASIHGSNYLHNLSSYDLGADFRTNIKICRGLFINVNFMVQKPQNQLYLPGSNVTTEEQLMGQKEMQTDYRFNCGIGFSYSFGSKNNNTVNPRFDF